MVNLPSCETGTLGPPKSFNSSKPKAVQLVKGPGVKVKTYPVTEALLFA